MIALYSLYEYTDHLLNEYADEDFVFPVFQVYKYGCNQYPHESVNLNKYTFLIVVNY